MTAMAVIRFELTEMREVAVVCRRCGAKRTYPLGKGGPAEIGRSCHNCGAEFGSEDKVLLYPLQQLVKQLHEDMDKYGLEFEMADEG